MHHLISDTGIALIAATTLGLVAHRLSQPVILGYLIAGVLIGPHLGLAVVHDVESIKIMAEIGLILLLFIVGLEINLKQVAAAGKQLLAVGLLQFPLSVAIGVAFFSLSGYALVAQNLEVLYLAVAASLSSTAIVVKALYDKGEFDTLPGRLTLGTLVFQDLFAIFFLALQPNLADPQLRPVLTALGSTVLLVLLGLVMSHYVLRRVFQMVAKTPEMVVCVAIAWCALGAAAGELLHLSMEMGALVAGLSIAAFPYSVHVSAKALALRDFFLTLFFVSIGMSMTLPASYTGVALLVLFAIVSRFLTVYPVLALTGAGRRAAFVSSLNLAQVSEFSLVIASIGAVLGHISQDIVSAIILAMSILAIVSSYLIRFSHPLFRRFDKGVSSFLVEKAQRKNTFEERHAGKEIVFFGFHRAGRALLGTLSEKRPDLLQKILVIDFNPLTLDELRARGIATMFGDIGSLDTLSHAHIEHAKVILSTIPDMLLRGVNNSTLCRFARYVAPQAVVVGTADDLKHEIELQREGVTLAARPFDVMGEWLADFVIDSVTSSDAWQETVTQITETGRFMALRE